MSKQKMTPSEVIENRLNKLVGEVLTIIEAVVPPVEQDLTYISMGGTITSSASFTSSRQNTQREAVKSLIKESFNRAHKDMQDWIK